MFATLYVSLVDRLGLLVFLVNFFFVPNYSWVWKSFASKYFKKLSIKHSIPWTKQQEANQTCFAIEWGRGSTYKPRPMVYVEAAGSKRLVIYNGPVSSIVNLFETF